ncbi:MAG: methyltransferase domain-containing protein [Actinomycetota bacterium]|nr:methyltransferase domain-containing protein [Actinomycetota bacterium]
MPDAWNPAQYERFAAERSAPFRDLAALLEPVPPSAEVVDLGCGTGELTAELHRGLGAARTTGVDSSDAMLERAGALDVAGLAFEPGDIATIEAHQRWDVVFSNAALQWAALSGGGQAAVLRRWAAAVRPGGQLAVQVPANSDHPSHTTIDEVVAEAPFCDLVPPEARRDASATALAPEAYAQLLFELGAVAQTVRLQVYAHVLAGPDEVVEWVKGTTLNRIRRVLGREHYDAFERRYRQRLLEQLGDDRPYLYPFKRILLWARFPG